MIRRPKNKKWRRRRIHKWGDRMLKLTGLHHVVYMGGVAYEIGNRYTVETDSMVWSADPLVVDFLRRTPTVTLEFEH